MHEGFRDDSWIDDLPTPLVEWCYSALHGGETHLRHFESINLFENLVKLMAMPYLAAYVEDLSNDLSSSRAVQKQLDKALPTPSFGSWVDLLNALSKHFAVRPDHRFSQLHEALNRDLRAADAPATLGLSRRIANSNKQKCRLLDLFGKLTQYRNENKGHPDRPQDAAASDEVLSWMSDAIREILCDGELPLLGARGSKLVYIDRIEKHDDRYEVQLLELKGSFPRRSRHLLGQEDALCLNSKRVAVLWPDQQLPFPLDPVLIYQETDKQVLYFDAKDFGRGDPAAVKRRDAVLRQLGPSGQREGQSCEDVQEMAEGCDRNELGTTYSLLPYLIDRTEQEFCVENVLGKSVTEQAPGVKVFIMAGLKEQCHSAFWDRLCQVTLPRLNHEPVDGPLLDCPFDVKRRDRTQFEQLLGRELTIRVGSISVGRSGVDVIQSGDQPRIIYTYLLSTDWNRVVEKQVDWFLQFWEQVQLPVGTQPQIVCLGVKYISGGGWWGGRRQRKKNAALMSWLDRLCPESYPGITLSKLPELPDVTLRHVVDWVNRYFKSDRRMKAFVDAFQPMPMQRFVDEYEKIVMPSSEPNYGSRGYAAGRQNAA